LETSKKNNLDIENMNTTNNNANAKEFKAPQWNIDSWVDAQGKPTKPINLSDYKGKFKVVFCFQSWCPGCHSVGIPSLQAMIESLKSNPNVVFLAIQTVFEGEDENTYEKMLETQKKYNLKIPFGQDNGDAFTNYVSNIMYHYKTGGTPWFIFIDQQDTIIFADFHLNTEKAIEFLEAI
jgi:thiol-disulfide isomerase/thioredoxin